MSGGLGEAVLCVWGLSVGAAVALLSVMDTSSSWQHRGSPACWRDGKEQAADLMGDAAVLLAACTRESQNHASCPCQEAAGSPLEVLAHTALGGWSRRQSRILELQQQQPHMQGVAAVLQQEQPGGAASLLGDVSDPRPWASPAALSLGTVQLLPFCSESKGSNQAHMSGGQPQPQRM